MRKLLLTRLCPAEVWLGGTCHGGCLLGWQVGQVRGIICTTLEHSTLLRGTGSASQGHNVWHVFPHTYHNVTALSPASLQLKTTQEHARNELPYVGPFSSMGKKACHVISFAKWADPVTHGFTPPWIIALNTDYISLCDTLSTHGDLNKQSNSHRTVKYTHK